MSKYEGKIALVTGAGSGIGRQTAIEFAKFGATVVVSDINAADANATVNAITENNGKAIFIQADMAKKTDILNLFEAIKAQFKSLDFAVNNAGIGGPYAPTHQYAEDAWDRVININQKGVFLCMQEELKIMTATGGGAIVNVASAAGLRALPLTIAYVASKHAVVGMTKTAAVEAGKMNVRINAICPFFSSTPMVDNAILNPKGDIEEVNKNLARGCPLKRIATVNEIVIVMVMMLSPQNTYMNGIALPVDGGVSAM